MRKYLPLNSLLCILFAGTAFLSFGQERIPSVFKETSYPASRSGEQLIQAKDFKVYEIDLGGLKTGLNKVAHRDDPSRTGDIILELPFPDGILHTFRVLENSTMHPELAAMFPEIKSYDAYGISHPGEFVKFDLTPQGFHAMAIIPGESLVFIDPLFKGQTDLCMVYQKKEFITSKTASCLVSEDEKPGFQIEENNRAPYASCNLRTYRLALAATGEYVNFHGGTVSKAQAAQVTTMNRVNGIYEKNLGITMAIIPNNHLLIYTNPATDPYSNGNASIMLTQNQTNITNVIGSASYDIGHVFGTNSGGVANLGSVCKNSQKAMGVTGSNAPIGDPFDVDYVAHEMGHQFGANHTQNNSCQQNGSTAVEPGSASTIMGYAGICSPNVQNNSDAYFHGVSLREIGLFISGSSHSCPVVSNLNNTAPQIGTTNGNVTIPKGTPFALTATASDVDGDILTYNWEQINNQVSSQPPVSTATGGPNFRSFNPSTNPTRYFPRLSALANNGPFTWEVLPTVGRTMNFRLTVQDNHGVASCNDYRDVSVTTSSTHGPFVVTHPNATGIYWAASSTENVTWDVAGTSNAPINCQAVDIFLSVDGGQTYPHILATGLPNNGSATVNVPAVTTNSARIMVMSANGTFFNISRFNFSISASDYVILAGQNYVSTCLPDPALYTININAVGTFSDQVTLGLLGLPAGATYNFNPPVVNPGSSSILTINSSLNTNPGNYNLTVTGTSNSGNKNYMIGYNAITVNNGIDQNGTTLVASQSLAKYQWIDCDNGNTPIPDETGRLFKPGQAGNYAVLVSIENCSAVSECVFYNYMGIDGTKENSLKIYPNPAKDLLFLNWENSEIQNIGITDVHGRQVLHLNKPVGHLASIDVSGLSSGLYFLQVESRASKAYYKIIKE